MRGTHCDRLMVGQAGGQRDGQPGVARDKRGPTAVSGKAADTIADVVVAHVRPDRRDDAGEIHTQLWLLSVNAGGAARRDKHIGEVDAGCAYRDLDLPRPRLNALKCGQFHCVQVPGRSNSQAMHRRARG